MRLEYESLLWRTHIDSFNTGGKISSDTEDTLYTLLVKLWIVVVVIIIISKYEEEAHHQFSPALLSWI